MANTGFSSLVTVNGTGAALATALGFYEKKEVGKSEGASLFNLLPRAGSSGLRLGTDAGQGSVLSPGSPEKN